MNIVAEAIKELEKSFSQPAASAHRPQDIVAYMRLKYGTETQERERFTALYMGAKNQVLDSLEFTGTVDQCAVYPREIVRRALSCNAVSVLCVHNHPSGHTDPSGVDKAITKRIRDASKLFDISLLDHIIIGTGSQYYSFADHGLLEGK